MKKYLAYILIIGLLLMVPLTSGCTKGCSKGLKHTKSKFIGLKREITWYDYNREIIKTWEGRLMVETIPGGIAFNDKNNKEVKAIGGLILVEEQ